MENAELIQRIVAEVLERLAAPKRHSCVRVLAERSASLEALVRPTVASHFGTDAELLFQGESMDGVKPEAYVLPRLSCSDMADLAVGRASNPIMEEVLELLLKGISVGVMEFGYHAYAESAPSPLYDLYASYEKKLAAYGVRPFAMKKPETSRLRERLVTAAMVEPAAENGVRTLVLSKDAKVTPLAAETANALHVNLNRE